MCPYEAEKIGSGEAVFNNFVSDVTADSCKIQLALHLCIETML